VFSLASEHALYKLQSTFLASYIFSNFSLPTILRKALLVLCLSILAALLTSRLAKRAALPAIIKAAKPIPSTADSFMMYRKAGSDT